MPKDKSFSKSDIKEGVYVWGYSNSKNLFIPLYVGKSRNIHERIIQHYCRFNGGEYMIPKEIHNTVTSAGNLVIDKTSSYCPSNLQVVHDLHNLNKNRYRDNQKYIFSNFRFQYFETKDKKLAEKYLGHKIGAERLISSVPSLNEEPDKQLAEKIDSVFKQHYKQ